MPLSSFAPLSGLLQGLQGWQDFQTGEQRQALNQLALQQAQQQQQVGPAVWNALLGGAGGLPQQTAPPFQPLTSPQQPQAPAPVGAPGTPQNPIFQGGNWPQPQAPGFQLPQVPSFGAAPFGQPDLSFLDQSQPQLSQGGLPLAIPGAGGTTYGVGGPLGPSGLGMPSALSGLLQQGTFPGLDGTTYGVGGFGAAAAPSPTGFSQVIPGSERPASPSDLAALGFGPPGSVQNPYLQAPQQPDTYVPDPLTGQLTFQPGTSAQQQQPQAPGPVGAPGTPPPPQGLPQQTGGAAGLFHGTIVPIESGGNMNIAPGSYGEIGPAQMLPDTFRQYAQPGEDIYNPQDNLRVGQRYADDLWQKSGGDAAATLVGYNRGEGAMRRFQAAGDDPQSVKLAPAYQQAVARQQGQQTYAEASSHIGAVTSPQEKALGAMGTRNTLGAMPNPLAYAGRVDAGELAQIIERTNPNVTPAVKALVFQSLYPMLSKEGQEQYNRAWDWYKYTHMSAEQEATAARAQEQKDWERYKFTHPSAGELLTAGRAGAGAPEVIETPQGMMQWDPQRRAFVPSAVPPGSHKMGAADPAKILPQIHTFRIPGQTDPVSVRQNTRGDYIDSQGNPVEIPPNAIPITTTQAGAGGGVSRAQAEWVATYVEKTGTWPTTSGRNLALTNQVEQILAKRGVDPEKIAQAMGTFGATKSSLTAATKLRDAVRSYEGTALRNLDQATKEMHGASPSDLGPWLNNWMTTGEMQIGNTKPPAQIAAVLTFANEYAKVMSGATGAAAATEGSRREAAELFNPYFSAGQWDEAARIAKTDMGNRMRELDDNVDVITSRLGRGAPAAEPGGQRRPPAAAASGGGPSADDIARMTIDDVSKLINSPDFDKLPEDKRSAIVARGEQLTGK
jgi:hypothetical protein